MSGDQQVILARVRVLTYLILLANSLMTVSGFTVVSVDHSVAREVRRPDRGVRTTRVCVNSRRVLPFNRSQVLVLRTGGVADYLVRTPLVSM